MCDVIRPQASSPPRLRFCLFCSRALLICLFVVVVVVVVAALLRFFVFARACHRLCFPFSLPCLFQGGAGRNAEKGVWSRNPVRRRARRCSQPGTLYCLVNVLLQFAQRLHMIHPTAGVDFCFGLFVR